MNVCFLFLNYKETIIIKNSYYEIVKSVSGPERESYALGTLVDFPGKKDFPRASKTGYAAQGRGGREKNKEPSEGRTSSEHSCYHP